MDSRSQLRRGVSCSLAGRLPHFGSAPSACQLQLDTCLWKFTDWGIPVHHGKIEGPSTCLTILGIELDSVRFEARLPIDKFNRISGLLDEWSSKRSCKHRELESLSATFIMPARFLLKAGPFYDASLILFRRSVATATLSASTGTFNLTSAGGEIFSTRGLVTAFSCCVLGPHCQTSRCRQMLQEQVVLVPFALVTGFLATGLWNSFTSQLLTKNSFQW